MSLFFRLLLIVSSFVTSQAVLANHINSNQNALEQELQWLQSEAIVFSASRKQEKVSDTASAVFVISSEDIRRSAANNIPDLLRMAPGVNVAQINANSWSISVRGFSERFANELLVLIDGRSVYSPTFSGVYWHREDVLLEDVERIEVIRGSGATMWGANAVNGVINIITKKAQETQGALMVAGAGKEEQAFARLRYGGKVGDNFFYRAYFKTEHHDALRIEPKVQNNLRISGDSRDDWEKQQGGFRTDWQIDKHQNLTLQGDLYYSRSGETQLMTVTNPPYQVLQDAKQKQFGGNLLGRWVNQYSDTDEVSLQMYYSQVHGRYELAELYSQNEKTLDIDFQHRFKWLDSHEFLWGLGYRHNFLNFDSVSNLSYDTEHRSDRLFSAFIQDEINLIDDRLKLIIGSKLQYNDYTDFEIQPNIRLLGKLNDHHTLWGAISRSVRTPNPAHHNMENLFFLLSPPDFATGRPAVLGSFQGDKDYDSLSVVSYEIGYRFNPNNNFSADITAFYNDYSRLGTLVGKLRQTQLLSSGGVPYLRLPAEFENKLTAEVYGIELSGQWQATDWLKFYANYSYLNVQFHQKSTNPLTDIVFVTDEVEETSEPDQQFYLKTSLDLPYNFELDGVVRYSSGNDDAKDYTAVDMRLGWQFNQHLDVSVIGQNIFDSHHSEYRDSIFNLPQVEVERSIYGKVNLKF